LQNAGDLSSAMADFNRAVSLEPTSATFFRWGVQGGCWAAGQGCLW